MTAFMLILIAAIAYYVIKFAFYLLPFIIGFGLLFGAFYWIVRRSQIKKGLNVENNMIYTESERIDFNNIEYVTLDYTETAYRIEEEEEFDPVMTDYLTRRDGWQHYETKIVEYEVEDGENYCFTIHYKNGTEIYRIFHESSYMAERLMEYVND